MPTKYIYLLLLVVALVFCFGLVAYQSAPVMAAQVATNPTVQPESCATCHKDGGAKHQASYDELYQDGSFKLPIWLTRLLLQVRTRLLSR